MKSNQKPKETKATIEQISLCKVQRRFNNKPFEIRIAGTRKMKSGRIESIELNLSASESDIAYLFETLFETLFAQSVDVLKGLQKERKEMIESAIEKLNDFNKG